MDAPEYRQDGKSSGVEPRPSAPAVGPAVKLNREPNREKEGEQRDELAIDEEHHQILHIGVERVRVQRRGSQRREDDVAFVPDEIGNENTEECKSTEDVDKFDPFTRIGWPGLLDFGD